MYYACRKYPRPKMKGLTKINPEKANERATYQKFLLAPMGTKSVILAYLIRWVVPKGGKPKFMILVLCSTDLVTYPHGMMVIKAISEVPPPS